MRTRQTNRYEADVEKLATYADLHAFQGSGSFYAWERLNALIARLEALYDAYELEGDAGRVRAEVESYREDLARFGLRPPEWVAAHLSDFLAWLEEAPVVEITVDTELASNAVRWPQGYLAVHPQELERRLREHGAVPRPGREA